MANNPGHSEIIETVVDVRMLEVVAEPDKKSSDAATSSIVEEDVSEIPRKINEVEGFGQRYVDEIETYCAMNWQSRNVVHDQGGSGFYKVPQNMRQRQGWERLFDPTYINFSKIRDMLENDDPDVQTRSLLNHYYYHFLRIHRLNTKVKLENYLLMIYEHRKEIARCYGVEEADLDFPQLLGLLLSICFVIYLFVVSFHGSAHSIEKDRECFHRWVNDLWVDLLVLENQIPFFILKNVFDKFNGERVFDDMQSYTYGKIAIEKDRECFHLWVNDLWVDLLVLENQIPLFILKRVLDKVKDRKPIRYMEIYTYSYFHEFVPLNRIEKNLKPVHLLDIVHRSLLPDKQSDHLLDILHRSLLPDKQSDHSLLPDKQSDHLLDIVHRSLLPDKQSDHRSYSFFTCLAYLWEREYYIPRSRKPPVMRVIPTATRLQEAGVQFRPVQRKGFVAEFKNGVLRLPRLHIRKNTEKFFMNLIAWEQCHQPAVKYVINFAILMDHLINTSKDVEILIQNNVLELSQVTEQEVAAMFNRLGEDLIYTENKEKNQKYDFLHELSCKLNKYCESRLNIWWANLMKVYFSSPWTILSLIAALLLLLTLVQAFFSAFSYFRPPK